MKPRADYRGGHIGPFDSVYPEKSDASGKTACEAAVRFLEKEGLGESYNNSVSEELYRIAGRYWSLYMFDQLRLGGSLNRELLSIENPAKDLIDLLQNLTPVLRHALSTGLSLRSINSSIRPNVDTLIIELRMLAEACFIYTSVRHTRLGTGSTRVHSICERLWLLREYLTDKSFVKNFSYSKHPGPVQTRRIELSAPDARFVEAIVQAIDPEVQSRSIRAALMDLAKTTRWKREVGPGPGGNRLQN